MKRVMILLAALLLVLASAVPAVAAKPVKVSDTYEETYVMFNCSEAFPDDPAYDFEVWNHSVRTMEGTWKYDRDGTLVGAVVRNFGVNTVSSPQFPGRTLTGPFGYTSHIEFVSFDPVQYYEHSTGTYWNLHVPGGGVAFHEAGQWSTLIEWPEDLPWPYFLAIFKVTGVSRFDGAKVCEALAG